MTDEVDRAARSGEWVSPWRRRGLHLPPCGGGRFAQRTGRGTLHSAAVRRLKSQRLLQGPLRLASLATSPTRGEGGARGTCTARMLDRRVQTNRPDAPYATASLSGRGS